MPLDQSFTLPSWLQALRDNMGQSAANQAGVYGGLQALPQDPMLAAMYAQQGAQTEGQTVAQNAAQANPSGAGSLTVGAPPAGYVSPGAPSPDAPQAPQGGDPSIPLPPQPPQGGPPGVNPVDAAKAAAAVPGVGPQTGPASDPLFSMISNAESSGGKASKNLYGFRPGTWDGFIKSPANTGNWDASSINDPAAQNAAAQWHSGQIRSALQASLGRDPTDADVLGAWHLGSGAYSAFLNNPNADAYSLYANLTSPQQADAAFSTNPKTLTKGITASQAIQNTLAMYHGGLGTSGEPSQGEPSGSGNNGFDLNKFNDMLNANRDQTIQAINNVPTAGNSQNVMLALASGLLGGPTFGAGLSKGLGSVIGLNQADQGVALKKAQAIAALNNTDVTRLMALQGMMNSQQYHAAQIANQQDRTQIMGNNSNLNAGRLNLSTAVQTGKMDGSTATNNEFAKNAVESATQMLGGESADQQTLKDAQVIQQLAGPNYSGSTIVAKAGRALTSLGLLNDPNDLSALTKASTAVRNESLSKFSGGHMGTFRSNAELNNLSGAYGDLNTNPAAAAWIANTISNGANMSRAWRQNYLTQQAQNPGAMSGQNYFTAEANFQKQWLQDHPLQDYNTFKATWKPPTGAAGDQSASPAAPDLSKYVIPTN